MESNLYGRHDAGNLNITIKYQRPDPGIADVCLFSSYSFSGIVEEYVYYYLQELKNAGFSIVFISTSLLKNTCIERLSEYAFLILERENKCPDFGSWKAGLSLLDWAKNMQSVLLVNDSVFGPFFNIGDIISSMKGKYDVWGMTESNEINYHIQSYFIHFNKAAIEHRIFSNFWQQVDLSASKDEVINRYEVGLSTLFSRNNFTLGAYAGIGQLTQDFFPGHKISNPTLVFWKTLIQQYKFPFLKRELLIKMNISKTYWAINLYINVSGWRRTILAATSYPVNYIEQFLHNYHNSLHAGGNIILQKRKILFITDNAADTDEQHLLLNFLRWLNKETAIKAEVVICNKSQNNLESQFAGLGTVTNFYELTNAAKRNLKDRLIDEIGLIFSNTLENISLQKFFSFLYIPRIVFVHESVAVLANCLSANNVNWLKKNVSQFIATTEATRQILTDELDIPIEKTALLHKFVTVENKDLSVERVINVRSLCGIPSDAFVVGMTGDWVSEKNADFLPVIAAELCRGNNDIHVIWYGVEDEATYEQTYFDLVRSGLTTQVHLVKKDADPERFIAAIDIFVEYSRKNSFPLINLEAALAGRPVVCFENPESTDEYAAAAVVQTVPYLNLHALVATILSYYNNRLLLTTEKERLSKIIASNFTTAVQAPRILQLIENYYDINELTLKEDPSLTFLTHIYYENSWDEIRNKLKNFDTGKNHFLFSISEACLIKEQIVADIKKTFTNTYVLITSNIGKDIGGKMALIDIYLLLQLKSDYIVFLHDKQSPHSILGESWKNGLFKIIDPNYQKMITYAFRDSSVGIVGDKDHIINEHDSITGKFRNNSQLSKKLLFQFDMSIDNYNFLGGSMYWIRSSIIEKFFRKNNPILMREDLEHGNVLDLHGEKLAHTWERMFSWIATNEGYTVKGV
ncbi:MAG: rhamnan synthesis F family protein [Chitinophagaceae bacterium]